MNEPHTLPDPFSCWWKDKTFGFALLLPWPIWFVCATQNLRPVVPWWMLLIVSPLIEEIAFRGTLQGLLLQSATGRVRVGVISVANGITALLFGVMHGLNHGSLVDLLTFFPGLVFGFFRERYALLLPVILLHSYYNAGLLWF